MPENALPVLPVGLFNFETLRKNNMLYIDKTAQLLELARYPGRFFLSRPRRFGKSLTLSTLDAMFSGKAELFAGLAAEAWVKEQSRRPCPVLRFDMSVLDAGSPEAFNVSLHDELARAARMNQVELFSQSLGGMFQDLVIGLYQQKGPVVVLIDEYDKPVLDNIGQPDMAETLRHKLRAFYTVVKACEDYLRFVMLTGISKFTKMGVFSAINNLNDISMDERFGALCGCTQEELERDLGCWVDAVAAKKCASHAELLAKMKDYYDGFCFDGITKVYNPFSLLQFLQKADFRNYWYQSASPSFVVEYMKQHDIDSPEMYRHIVVGEEFTSAQEIERAAPESFCTKAVI